MLSRNSSISKSRYVLESKSLTLYKKIVNTALNLLKSIDEKVRQTEVPVEAETPSDRFKTAGFESSLEGHFTP